MSKSKSKPIHERSDDDIIRIVGEDFSASEWARREKNDQNFMAYRAFHCRDLVSSGDVRRVGSLEEVIGPLLSTAELDSVAVNSTYVPWLRGIIMTSVARLAAGIWPDLNDFFRIDPATPEDEGSAQASFALLSEVVRQSDYRNEALLALLQAHYFDFSILYTGWKTDRSFVPRPVDHEVMIKNFDTGEWIPTGKVDSERREFDWHEESVSGWDVGCINTMNFRVDPMAGHKGFGEFCGITCKIPKRQMWEMAAAGEWNPAAVAMIDPDETAEDAGADEGVDDMAARLKEDEKVQGFNFDSYVESRYVRADMYWTPTSKVVVLNRRAVALKDKSFRIPFHKIVFYPNVGMFGGTSLAEKLLPVQLDINRCVRLIRTQQEREATLDSVVDPSWFGSLQEAEAQPWGTGATMILSRNQPGRDPAQVRRFIQYPSGTVRDVWNSITLQTSMGERSVGLSIQAQGELGPGSATATAVRDATAGSDIRTKLIDMWMEDGLVLQPLADLIDLMSLNVTVERMVKMRGAEGMKWRGVSPKDLLFKQPPYIIPLGMSSMSSRGVSAQAFRDVTMAFSQNPFFQQHLLPLQSMQEIYRMMDFDPKRVIADQGMADQVNVPPEWVPGLLAVGRNVPVNPWDDHNAVILAIRDFSETPDFEMVPDSSKIAILEHVRLRKAALTVMLGGNKGLPSLPNDMAGGGGGMQSKMQPSLPPTPQPPAAGVGSQQSGVTTDATLNRGPVP